MTAPTAMDDVERMYRHLVRTIRANFPQLLTQPFPVAELYQNILPYRLHRRELGLETNQDYESTLLSLLSGARNYLLIDDRMREALSAELASPNPNPLVIRDFAAARIALAPEPLRQLEMEGRPSDAQAGGRSTPGESDTVTAPMRATVPSVPSVPSVSSVPVAPPAPAAAPAPSAPVAPPMQAPPAARAPAPAPAPAQPPAPAPAPRAASEAHEQNARTEIIGAQSAPTGETPSRRPTRPITVTPGEESCPFCKGELPVGRALSFCPHCGQDLTIVHCPACGSELERGWKFCVTCGRSTAGL
jgi:hypothetical protein